MKHFSVGQKVCLIRRGLFLNGSIQKEDDVLYFVAEHSDKMKLELQTILLNNDYIADRSDFKLPDGDFVFIN
jgi:hypothetical protein